MRSIQRTSSFHTNFRLPHPSWRDFRLLDDTVYQQIHIPYDAAVAFFEAGLTDIDYVVEEITPLTCFAGPEMRDRRHFFHKAEFFVDYEPLKSPSSRTQLFEEEQGAYSEWMEGIRTGIRPA